VRRSSLVFAAIACGCSPEHAPEVPEEAWSFVVLPDTQVYSRSHPEIFEAQTEWIAARHDELDIRFVLHVGDLTDTNSREEWERARDAMSALDGVVPYAFVPGNHDYGDHGNAADRRTLMNEYFSYAEQPAGVRGTFEAHHTDDSFHVFDTPSGPWLVLALEFAPRPGVLAWARRVADRYRAMPAILVTHAYLYEDGTRYDGGSSQRWAPERYGLGATGADGETIWNELVRERSAFEMVVCGHVLGRGAARLTSEREDGPPTHQLLANFQHGERGGNGFLRLVEVHPDRFFVRTYSPFAGRYRREAEHEFTLPRTDRGRSLLAGR
jgi:hypothetical protein